MEKHNWIIEKKEPIEVNRLFTAVKAEVCNPRNKNRKEFVRLELADWVNILAITAEKEVVLVRQFRFGSEQMEWELPGGVVEAGEPPLEAGIRELKEESGFAGDSARILTTFAPNPAVQNNEMTVILVENAVKVAEQQLDPMEDIEVHLVKLDTLITMIQDGTLRQSFTHAALFHYLLQTGQVHKQDLADGSIP